MVWIALRKDVEVVVAYFKLFSQLSAAVTKQYRERIGSNKTVQRENPNSRYLVICLKLFRREYASSIEELLDLRICEKHLFNKTPQSMVSRILREAFLSNLAPSALLS
jgi:hypothetical protein